MLAWLVVIISRVCMIVLMVFGAALLGLFMLFNGTDKTATVMDMIADLFRKYKL